MMAAALAAAARPATGLPPDKAACVSAYEAGQRDRSALLLRAARARLLPCAQPTCPAAMQRECMDWLSEVDAALPTIVVRARLPGGQEITDVRVLVDGEEAAASLDGKALAVDPGERRLRFEHDPLPPVEQTLVIHEGEKLRPIAVDFSNPPPPPGEPRRLGPALVLGGVAFAGLAAFAILGTTGVSRYDSLEKSCAPNCAKSDSNAVKTTFLAADISLGIGLSAAAGTAAYLLLTGPRHPAAPTTASLVLGVAPAPGGALAAARVRF
jgi:hypothetical protein